MGSKVSLENTGHFIGPEIYSFYSFVKNITEDDEGYLKSKDVVNLLNMLKKTAPDGDMLEKDFENICNEDGEVKWNIDKESRFMDVILVQIKAMQDQVHRVKSNFYHEHFLLIY